MLIIVILLFILFILLGSIRIKLQELLDLQTMKNQVKNQINGDVSTVYSVRENGERSVSFLVYMEERWQWVHGENCIPAVKNSGEDEGIDDFGDHRQ